MSKHARDHAHCSDQSVPKRGHPNHTGRGLIHTPPDQAGFTRTNSTVFNPKILEASIKEIASRLEDGAKADLLLYAAKKMDVSHDRLAPFPYNPPASRLPSSRFFYCQISPRVSFPSCISLHRARYSFYFQCYLTSALVNSSGTF
jgi:hypothetical protein